MLRAKVLPQLLEQLNTSGVQTSVLLTEEGSLLGYAGDKKQSVVIAAIAANIFKTYENANAKHSDGNAPILLIDCEQGKLSVTRASKMILCILSEPSVEFGVLRQKTETMRAHLHPQLSSMFA
eukprot:TRINITY_DN1123_c0_g2_i1.p1 TRINITY_DN1123_c0_g2~~TRINITY_DN1123_c0_g2_i1.p1  ORF type:complete len:123 (-),score=28.08 TRINITY_DN1123_c0_g2_i1:165-533(-)